MLHAQVNVPLEFGLRAEQTHADLANQVEVDVLFTGPEGRTWLAPAFWAGEDRFRVRLAAPEPGSYTWESRCTEPSDLGLHGQTGALSVRPYAGENPLYRHGRLRVAENHHTLEHADGTPFLWLADTWWAGLTGRLDWPHGFQRLTADRVAKGFNVIQIVAGGQPDADAGDEPFDPRQANAGGLPWEAGWTRLNPAYFDEADLRLAWLVEAGFVPCLVAMWGFFLPVMGLERVRRHWRNLVARYAAYPVVWCLAGEINMPSLTILDDAARWEAETAAQIDAWTEVGRYVRGLDPYHNLLSLHPAAADSREQIRDESLLDLNMLHVAHGGYEALRPALENVVRCRAQEPPLPAFLAEVNYEGILGANHEEVQRFEVWMALTAGACGHTYGAQGVWAMNSPEYPQWDYSGSWGDTFWSDAMHYPGSGQMGHARRLFERYPWWRFASRPEPRAQEAGRLTAYATGLLGEVAIFYLPLYRMGEGLEGLVIDRSGNLLPIAIEPGARYRAFFYNPRTGGEVRTYHACGNRVVELDLVEPNAEGFWQPPPKPTMEDWVLVLEAKS
jgi:hypothetical protein